MEITMRYVIILKNASAFLGVKKSEFFFIKGISGYMIDE